mmetsp:Transcript_1814/g.4977  ORF Transcript_1814/g.4977 Transcript_1814/m.4977 type:complete len:351 (-) Transcript_1814:266-1318(-)
MAPHPLLRQAAQPQERDLPIHGLRQRAGETGANTQRFPGHDNLVTALQPRDAGRTLPGRQPACRACVKDFIVHRRLHLHSTQESAQELQSLALHLCEEPLPRKGWGGQQPDLRHARRGKEDLLTPHALLAQGVHIRRVGLWLLCCSAVAAAKELQAAVVGGTPGRVRQLLEGGHDAVEIAGIAALVRVRCKSSATVGGMDLAAARGAPQPQHVVVAASSPRCLRSAGWLLLLPWPRRRCLTNDAPADLDDENWWLLPNQPSPRLLGRCSCAGAAGELQPRAHLDLIPNVGPELKVVDLRRGAVPAVERPWTPALPGGCPAARRPPRGRCCRGARLPGSRSGGRNFAGLRI